jgi:hypothetical protein
MISHTSNTVCLIKLTYKRPKTAFAGHILDPIFFKRYQSLFSALELTVTLLNFSTVSCTTRLIYAQRQKSESTANAHADERHVRRRSPSPPPVLA